MSNRPHHSSIPVAVRRELHDRAERRITSQARIMRPAGVYAVWTHDGAAPRLLGTVDRTHVPAVLVTAYGREATRVYRDRSSEALRYLALTEALRRLDADSAPAYVTDSILASVTVEARA